MLDLFGEVCRAGSVPQDWENTIIVVIRKKRYLSFCDKFGEGLLDVFGKLGSCLHGFCNRGSIVKLMAGSRCVCECVLLWYVVLCCMYVHVFV